MKLLYIPFTSEMHRICISLVRMFFFKTALVASLCNRRTGREPITIIKFQSPTWASITKSISYALEAPQTVGTRMVVSSRCQKIFKAISEARHLTTVSACRRRTMRHCRASREFASCREIRSSFRSLQTALWKLRCLKIINSRLIERFNSVLKCEINYLSHAS